MLAQYGSPATGQGATLYDGGVQAGIDPAYGVAFFVVESSPFDTELPRLPEVPETRSLPAQRRDCLSASWMPHRWDRRILPSERISQRFSTPGCSRGH